MPKAVQPKCGMSVTDIIIRPSEGATRLTLRQGQNLCWNGARLWPGEGAVLRPKWVIWRMGQRAELRLFSLPDACVDRSRGVI